MITAAAIYMTAEGSAKLLAAVFGPGTGATKAGRLLGVALNGWIAWILWSVR